jgi:hypothetical protein
MAALVLFGAACRREISRPQLIGIYVCSSSDSDTLELKQDGTYVHKYLDPRPSVPSSGKEISEKSSWTFEERADGPTIVFQDFFPAWPTHLPRARSFWIVKPDRTGWRRSIILNVDPDVGTQYTQRP